MARPREFDRDKALQAAMLLFWQKGYEGSSYADLSKATGVAPAGLYAAFGDKQTLFLEALHLYARQETGFVEEALNEKTAVEVIAVMLRQAARANMQPSKPRGCLGINGALACSDQSLGIQEALNKRREASFAALRDRLKRAQREGDVAQEIDAGALARLVMTLMQGVAVQAKAGTSRAQIDRVLEMAIAMIRDQLGRHA